MGKNGKVIKKYSSRRGKGGKLSKNRKVRGKYIIVERYLLCCYALFV
jgi:hypothetical protein